MARKCRYQKLGDRLCKALITEHMSLHRLAKKLNTSPKLVRSWLRGQRVPEPIHLGHLAYHLDIHLDELTEIASYTEYGWLLARDAFVTAPESDLIRAFLKATWGYFGTEQASSPKKALQEVQVIPSGHVMSAADADRALEQFFEELPPDID